MRIDVLNGAGFSRVTPNPNSQLGGYSRVNKSESDTYLSGYRLNSTDNYILSGKAERQARREKRKDRREDRQENRQERRDTRQANRQSRQDARSRRREARTSKKEKRAKDGGFMKNLLDTGREVWQDIKPAVIAKIVPEEYQDLAYDMLDQGYEGEEIKETLLDYMEEDGYTDEGDPTQKGLFNKKTWWEKRSTGEKAGVIIGSVVLLDLLAKGPISTNLLGMKKAKKR
jgi:hypothetical protein